MTIRQNFLVTGGSSGIGYFIVEQLVAAGHRVTIAARNADRAAAAISAIQRRTPEAALTFQQLDLGSLASVQEAAGELLDHEAFDAVIANAGVVHQQGLNRTSDGFELFFGTNHLGHFALLARLFPALRKHPGSRIVHLGSISHLWARPVLGEPGQYGWFTNYQNSKLAVMQFGFELDRRLREHRIDVQSVVAHPGSAPEQFTPQRPGLPASTRLPAALRALGSAISQGKDAGAWPIVHAATAVGVPGGSYWGPSGIFHLAGEPVSQRAAARAYQRAAARRLWDLSVELSGVDFEF
ncbi:SDR family NAD(P)-dependent oxidoreductase [Psychromicrobium sp. YIM B11713]|uniref:SDR family NAD(P)-dependent oxidoreductase n=1 Tax=Psychromicrobium sp. YIM B11713 TaxID=3145233 RepID=UPI00374F6052